MKKLILLSLTMWLAALSAFASRSFDYDESQYKADAVVYAVLADANGIAKSYHLDVYAFIGDECRGKATTYTNNSGHTTYIFRIGVNEADAGKKVNFVVQLGFLPSDEYTLAETVTVSGNDETVSGPPSDPIKLTFVPIEQVSSPSITMYPGEQVDLTEHFTTTPKNANLPDVYGWSVGNYIDFLQLDGNHVTALKPSSPELPFIPVELKYTSVDTEGQPVKKSATGGIKVLKPIESVEWGTTGQEAIIRIPLGTTFDDSYIFSFFKINPEDATETLSWESSSAQNLITPEERGYQATAVGKANLKVTSKNVEFPFVLEVYQPVTALNKLNDQLYLPLGTNVNDILPYTFSVEPADATDAMKGISYMAINGNTPIFKTADDGTITIVGTGDGQIQIQHSDIPNSPLIINVAGIQEPKDADFSFGANPLSITLTEDQLSNQNIYEELRDNFISHLWEVQIKLPNGTSPFYLYEAGEDGILYIDLKMNEVTASKYGDTKVGLKYYYNISVLNGTTITNEQKEYSISYDLSIVKDLSSISINPLVIGLEDNDALITITTEPEGIILDDDKIKFVIPNGADGKPAMNVQRIDGTNQWRVIPESLIFNEYSVSYGNMVANYERLSITQRILLKSGWNWIATYANAQKSSSGEVEDVFANVQEIRTQDRLYYNDPQLGWFTENPYINYNEAVKMQVKDGESLNLLCDDMSDYNNAAVQKDLRSNWNWFAFPYCYDHSFKEIFDGQYAVKMPDNSRIISKDDGFATYVEGAWQGNLDVIRAGQSYMIFYADPTSGTQITLAPESDLGRTNALRMPTRSASAYNTYVDNNWDYNASEFADNMTIIASVEQNLEENRYSVGAYVNGECRGKGKMVGSRFFITAHGISGEKVDFVIYDKLTGKFYKVDNSLTFSETAGTFNTPVVFNAPAVSGIDNIDADTGIIVTIEADKIVVKGTEASRVEVFTLSGQRVPTDGLASGTYIVRVYTDQGVVTKKIVKW